MLFIYEIEIGINAANLFESRLLGRMRKYMKDGYIQKTDLEKCLENLPLRMLNDSSKIDSFLKDIFRIYPNINLIKIQEFCDESFSRLFQKDVVFEFKILEALLDLSYYTDIVDLIKTMPFYKRDVYSIKNYEIVKPKQLFDMLNGYEGMNKELLLQVFTQKILYDNPPTVIILNKRL